MIGQLLGRLGECLRFILADDVGVHTGRLNSHSQVA